MQNHGSSLIKSLIPPIALDLLRRISGVQIRFVGDFQSWAEAEAVSNGYSAQVILDRTIRATRKVRDAEVAYERDSVTFSQMEYNFPLAWALMCAASRHGRLHVLDFGGALGSTYFQLRFLVNSTPHVKWAIVEQPAHVEAGAKEFANQELSFHRTIEDACANEQFDVLLLSGVIQYLPDPFGFLDSVLERRVSSVILDRAPMMNGNTRLTIQHVPKRIYPATYPAWFLSESEFRAKFRKAYELKATWPALDNHHPQGGQAHYKGFLFELKPSALTVSS